MGKRSRECGKYQRLAVSRPLLLAPLILVILKVDRERLAMNDSEGMLDKEKILLGEKKKWYISVAREVK
jgi:hypothetical protein